MQFPLDDQQASVSAPQLSTVASCCQVAESQTNQDAGLAGGA